MAIRTLILSGENNHDWRRSSPFVRELLEGTGKFAVDMVENPGEVLEDAAAIATYDLLFSDYHGPDWSAAAQENFAAAVRRGTGFVALHGADNAFPGWVEYEKILGLLWRDGSGHGAYHEFTVTIRDHEHPITRGLADFQIWDELYHKLVPMHDIPYQALATAYSDPESGGTGQDEPMMVVTEYGAGRVFHMVLGHVWPEGVYENYPGDKMTTFENPDFQQALIRGCLWAAGAEVDRAG
jgi:uncharacterized protein